MADTGFKNSVFYDLGQNPITFDFAVFLAYARLSLVGRAADPDFCLHIGADKWRNITPREQAYTLKERFWRLHNLITPICSLSPNILGYSIFLDDRWRSGGTSNGLTVFADGKNYTTKFLVDVVNKTGLEPHLFKAPEIALQYADRILSSSTSPVVISIRPPLLRAPEMPRKISFMASTRA